MAIASTAIAQSDSVLAWKHLYFDKVWPDTVHTLKHLASQPATSTATCLRPRARQVRQCTDWPNNNTNSIPAHISDLNVLQTELMACLPGGLSAYIYALTRSFLRCKSPFQHCETPKWSKQWMDVVVCSESHDGIFKKQHRKQVPGRPSVPWRQPNKQVPHRPCALDVNKPVLSHVPITDKLKTRGKARLIVQYQASQQCDSHVQYEDRIIWLWDSHTDCSTVQASSLSDWRKHNLSQSPSVHES